MQKVRAKFQCHSVTDYQGGTKDVRLTAVTGGNEENESFWKYTPAGEVTMHIDNPEAAKMFKPGDEYYIDFTKAK